MQGLGKLCTKFDRQSNWINAGPHATKATVVTLRTPGGLNPGKWTTFRLYSTDLDNNTGRGKLSPCLASLRNGSKTKTGDINTMTYRVSFILDESFGTPGAIVVKNEERNEFFLKFVTLEMPGKRQCGLLRFRSSGASQDSLRSSVSDGRGVWRLLAHRLLRLSVLVLCFLLTAFAQEIPQRKSVARKPSETLSWVLYKVNEEKFHWVLWVLYKVNEEKFMAKMEAMRGFGWSEADFLAAFRKTPAFLTSSVSTMLTSTWIINQSIDNKKKRVRS